MNDEPNAADISSGALYAIYTRCSTDNQGADHMRNQEQACRAAVQRSRTNNGHMGCAIYVRSLSDSSIEAQLRECVAAAVAMGLTVRDGDTL
jgi:hypothetical protein